MAARQKAEEVATRQPSLGEDIDLESPLQSPESFQQEMERILAYVEGAYDRAVAEVKRLEGELSVARENLGKLDSMLGKGSSSSAPRQRMASSSNAPKSPKGYWKEKVYPVLEDKPDGMRKQDIVEALGLSNNVKGAQALASALMHMKRTSVLVQRDGRYAIP